MLWNRFNAYLRVDALDTGFLVRPKSENQNSTGTREKLIEVAVEMFAERGLHGVSLREIGERAGAKNTAVVHYHLGDRRQLILAALDLVASAVSVDISFAAAAKLGLSVRTRNKEPWTIVAKAMLPIATLPLRHSWGGAGITFLNRLLCGEGVGFAVDVEKRFGESAGQLAEILLPYAPGLDRKIMLKRIDFMIVNFVAGMAALGYVDETNRAGLTPTIEPAAHFKLLVDYSVGGLFGPSTLARI